MLNGIYKSLIFSIIVSCPTIAFASQADIENLQWGKHKTRAGALKREQLADENINIQSPAKSADKSEVKSKRTKVLQSRTNSTEVHSSRKRVHFEELVDVVRFKNSTELQEVEYTDSNNRVVKIKVKNYTDPVPEPLTRNSVVQLEASLQVLYPNISGECYVRRLKFLNKMENEKAKAAAAWQKHVEGLAACKNNEAQYWQALSEKEEAEANRDAALAYPADYIRTAEGLRVNKWSIPKRYSSAAKALLCFIGVIKADAGGKASLMDNVKEKTSLKHFMKYLELLEKSFEHAFKAAEDTASKEEFNYCTGLFFRSMQAFVQSQTDNQIDEKTRLECLSRCWTKLESMQDLLIDRSRVDTEDCRQLDELKFVVSKMKENPYYRVPSKDDPKDKIYLDRAEAY